MAAVVFMGTPEYALPTLDALHVHHQVVLVVTQPDRRQGRGRKLRPPPVKQVALEHGLPVWQPSTLRTPEAVERLRGAGADVYVTAAIGFLLPPDVLALPPRGCLNVHASLLPRWRGAAPVSAAILHGDAETGITLMQTEEGLDTGPIVASARCAIQPQDTTESLTRRLADLGAELVTKTLPGWLTGQIVPQPQPKEGITYAPRILKDDGRIDWRRSAVHIERMVRAYTPWPGASTSYDGRSLKIHRARPLPDWRGDGVPGQVFALPDNRVAVATGQGALELHEIQLAGKRALATEAFCCGYHGFVGSVLGRTE
jgi:methionyl-tRNA formyltransferase